MKFIEAKAKLEELLGKAKDALTIDGITVSTELDITENPISDEESEPIMILGSVALTAEGFGEEDTYYISAEARIEGGEANDAALEDAIARFNTRLDAAVARLSAADDKSATLLQMGKEIDDELQRIYEEEAARSERLIKRDLMRAIIGSAAILLFVIGAFVISALI